MLIVFLTICVLFLIGMIYLTIWLDRKGSVLVIVTGTLVSSLGLAIVLIFIMICICICDVANLKAIDKKTMMYQDENKNIEKQVNEVVNQYQNYEKEVITNTGQMTSVLIKIPELKTNTLVTKQIDLYIDNNNKIKDLKEKKIEYQLSKWWLYFG